MHQKLLEFVCGRFRRLTGRDGVATLGTSTRKDALLMNAVMARMGTNLDERLFIL